MTSNAGKKAKKINLEEVRVKGNQLPKEA